MKFRVLLWYAVVFALGLTAGGCTTQRSDAVEFIAHRGASYAAPENTLAAFELAWRRDADAVEVDIRLSRDGRIILMHDNTTGRTAGKDRPAVEQTLAELKALDAGVWKGKKWAGQTIPTLAEVLDTVPDGRKIYIEIKCGPEVVPALKRVVEASGLEPAQTVIFSFDLRTVRAVRKAMPDQQVLLSVKMRKNGESGRWAPMASELIDLAGKAGLDGIAPNACDAIDEDFVRQVRAAGLSIHVWTVDKPALAEKMIRAGVKSIITNRPQWLRRQLEKKRR